ncbi:MAG TPA: ankyrin repeat domain-containing protein [Edaphobacter sp.]|nr:ankyrin repeat domain-containing protein [Edaphobacter sp.]
MDVKELPSRASLEQYKKQAKALLKNQKNGDADALERMRQHHPRLAKLTESELRSGKFLLADAQLVVAREHGFESWPRFAKHVEALSRRSSSTSKFESAVDAVIAGDTATLERLLRENPELVRSRSTRRHRATLLLYVGANGVEDYRQRSPKNSVEIAEMLLKAGADVNAVGEMYGGSTTLGLVATSGHPLRTGVQEALIDTLLAHGASFDGAVAPDYTVGSIVNACLANGRGGAAAYLARRGARLDLEGAAGVGQVEVVKSFFDEDGSLKAGTTKEQMKSGFNWACEYGWSRVVDFLLRRGIHVGERHRGATGLHWAALGADAETVKLLLERKAPVDVEDETWNGTPLGWALHGWLNPSPEIVRDGYYEVAALLVAAGSAVRGEWLASDKVRADPRMLAALGAKMSG